MLSKETQQNLQERLEALPKVLSDALFSKTLEQVINQIAVDQNVRPDRHNDLANEITLVLLAFEPYQDLAENIARELVVPAHTAERIAQAAYEQIFTEEIRVALDDIYAARPDTDENSVSQQESTARSMSETSSTQASYKKPLTEPPQYNQ